MEKYKFENNKAVVDLPCIITISKSSISIEHASNTDSADIPDAGLTILVGNIESYNPTNLSPEPEPEITPNPSSGGSSSGSGSDNEGGNSGGQEGGGDNPDTPVDPTPTPTPSGNGIILHITNNLNTEVRLSGKVVLNVGRNANSWDNVGNATQVEANMFSDNTNTHLNNISIPAKGEYTSRLMLTTKIYNSDIYQNGTKIQLGSPSYSELIDGSWNILGVQNPVNLSMPIYLYSAFEYGNAAPNDSDHARNVAHSSSSMYITSIPDSTLILDGKTFNLSITKTMQDTSGNTMTLEPDTTGYYVVLKPEETTQNPTPTPGQSNISINLNITNNSGRTVSLDGDVVFVLANPDIYGNYYGWLGTYNRTDHLNFNTGAITLENGESRTVAISGELGNRSPMSPLTVSLPNDQGGADRPRNVLLYVGGNSEVVLADNMDPSIVFLNGGSYNINITQ